MKMIFHSKPDKSGVRLTVAGKLDGNRLNIGVARCSKNDQFTRKKGASIAYGRACAKNPILSLSTPDDHLTKYFVENAKQIAENFRNHPERINNWKK